MITETHLKEMGFAPEDIEFVMELNSKYAHIVIPMAEDYMSEVGEEAFSVYKDGEREALEERTDRYIASVREALAEVNEYTSRMLAWLCCVPILEKRFEKHGICRQVFFDSMKDLGYKLQECKDVYGIRGLFTDWFYLFFSMKLVSLGRLEYEAYPFDYVEYTAGDYSIKKGDRVFFCHIPSSGRLTEELCMDSLRRAYEFFKPTLNGSILPVICYSWLFYKPYLEKVFPHDSNIKRFAELFDMINGDSDGNDFKDCWRVFGKMYEGSTCGLATDNTLRRSFVDYINAGGDFGWGYGVILYDGEKGEIVNKNVETHCVLR